MGKKNLLFVCGNIGENSSQGVRYKNLLPSLAAHYSITLFSFNHFSHQAGIENITVVQGSGAQTAHKSLAAQVSFIVKLKAVYKKLIRPFIFPDKYKYYIPAYKKTIRKLLQQKEFVAVVVAMTPYSLYVLPKFIKNISPSLKVIIDLSDPFLSNASSNFSAVYSKQFIRKFEKKNLEFIDQIVVLNPVIRDYYIQTYELSGKVKVVEQGLDKVLYTANEPKTTKSGSSVLVYGGGLYHKLREPFELYNAINQLRQVSLKVYGNIDKTLQPANCKRIKYFGLVKQQQLLSEYLEADILVFIDNAFGMQVPGKILELMAMGKPVLFIYSNVESPTLRYAALSGQVVMVKNKQDEIEKGIENILNSTFETVPKPNLNVYYWKNLAKKYKKIING